MNTLKSVERIFDISCPGKLGPPTFKRRRLLAKFGCIMVALKLWTRINTRTDIYYKGPILF